MLIVIDLLIILMMVFDIITEVWTGEQKIGFDLILKEGLKVSLVI